MEWGWLIVAWIVLILIIGWSSKRFPWKPPAMRNEKGSCYFCGEDDCNNDCLERK